MDEFARRPTADRRAFIEEAAARRDLTAIVVEKDFWVCWTLRRLTACTDLVGQLTFKGGTSLSKAYGIIERFSEDVDLTISRSAPLLADVASPMEDGISGKELDRRIKAIKSAAQTYVEEFVLPLLAREIETALRTADGWSLQLDPEDKDGQSLLFVYPPTSGYGLDYGRNYGGRNGSGYIKPRIKLEFGARGEAEPFEPRSIMSYLAEGFPDELPNAITEVPTLAVERTYWEKITILHALYHNGKLREGMSRHYYDVLKLDQANITPVALARPELLHQVVKNKSLMFADKSASYGTAEIGTLRLGVTEVIRDKLARDYEAMSEMFMSTPPRFGELLDGLKAIEATLNSKI